MRDSLSALRTVVAFPGMNSVEPAVKAEMELDQAATGNDLRFLPYTLPAASPSRIPWLAPTSTYQAIFAMARELGVSACAVIGFDLAALQTHFLGPMLAPVLENRCELAMPLYSMGKFDGLLNSSILAPLTRALYGKRVRFPLAPDFCIAGKMIAELEVALQRSTAQGQDLLLAGNRGCSSRLPNVPGKCGHAARSARRRRRSEHRYSARLLALCLRR